MRPKIWCRTYRKYINVAQERIIRKKKISTHNLPIKPMKFHRFEMSFSDLITTTDRPFGTPRPYVFVEDILNLYDVPSYNRTLSTLPIASQFLTKPQTFTADPLRTLRRPLNRGTVFVYVGVHCPCSVGLCSRVERARKGEKKRTRR